MITLTFTNKDAVPQKITLRVSEGSIPYIMAWYGAYYAGDDYTVAKNGRVIPMDQNGEPI